MRRPNWLPTVSLLWTWPRFGLVVEWPMPKLTRAPRPDVPRRTLIVAQTYGQAREHARRHLKPDADWRYASRWEDLVGARNVTVVRLEGWQIGRSWEFVNEVQRRELEA